MTASLVGIGHIKLKETWILEEQERLIDSIDKFHSKQRFDGLNSILTRPDLKHTYRNIPIELLRD